MNRKEVITIDRMGGVLSDESNFIDGGKNKELIRRHIRKLLIRISEINGVLNDNSVDSTPEYIEWESLMKERETNFEEIWKLYCEYHNISNERQIVGNMTPEELSEIMRLANAGRPQVNQTFNFNAPIGQQIAHVDKIEAHFDKDMGMQIAQAENVSAPSDIALPQDVTPSTPIYLNSIFTHKMFNTNTKVVRLRDAIGARIKGAKLTDGSGLAEDRPQMDPTMQNEWYYVWKMIAELELLDRKVTVRAFIAQMLEWYPEVFEPVADEEQKKAFVGKMEKSISREKSRWVQDRQEVPFKDMMSKWPELQLDHNKVKQMFLVCRDLRDALQNLKSAIEQEEAAKGDMPPA